MQLADAWHALSSPVPDSVSVTCSAPVNIAVIKYWSVDDEMRVGAAAAGEFELNLDLLLSWLCLQG